MFFTVSCSLLTHGSIKSFQYFLNAAEEIQKFIIVLSVKVSCSRAEEVTSVRIETYKRR